MSTSSAVAAAPRPANVIDPKFAKWLVIINGLVPAAVLAWDAFRGQLGVNEVNYAIRTTGMGWAIGIGRLGAILAPLTAGLLVDAGWETAHLYYVFAVPFIGALLALRALRV